jgi:hypothetical protein
LIVVGAPAIVWIVNADHWTRAYLRAELIERGHDAIGFVAVKDAIFRLIVSPLQRPALLVIDLHEQPIDDKQRNALIHQRVPVLAIVDATYATIAPPGLFVDSLRRPLTIGAIADAIDRRIAAHPVARGE